MASRHPFPRRFVTTEMTGIWLARRKVPVTSIVIKTQTKFKLSHANIDLVKVRVVAWTNMARDGIGRIA
jgi:hypothetical protein